MIAEVDHNIHSSPADIGNHRLESEDIPVDIRNHRYAVYHVSAMMVADLGGRQFYCFS